jgi:hypothetical protein
MWNGIQIRNTLLSDIHRIWAAICIVITCSSAWESNRRNSEFLSSLQNMKRRSVLRYVCVCVYMYVYIYIYIYIYIYAVSALSTIRHHLYNKGGCTFRIQNRKRKREKALTSNCLASKETRLLHHRVETAVVKLNNVGVFRSLTINLCRSFQCYCYYTDWLTSAMKGFK